MEGDGPKICVVGGGSYTWCPTLLSDVMQTDELEGAEIALLDINVEAAEAVRAAAETMAKTLKKTFNVYATDDEAAAFRHADFVLITISTGGLKAMTHDLAIPEKYGIYHTVGDTCGPAGWCRSLRNIPVFAHLSEQIEKSAPHAVVLNYTNPMACLTGTIAAVSSLRHVGLCHGMFGTVRVLQDLFGVEERDLGIRFGGVNHFFWVLDFTVKGEPGYPLLAEKLAEKSLDEALREAHVDEHGFAHTDHRVCDQLYREYGCLPYAGDRHSCEFFPGYLTPDESRLTPYKLVRTTIEHREDGFGKCREKVRQLAAGEIPPFPQSRETAVDIMKALKSNEPFFDVVNLPNIGQIDNLPRDAVVETMGRVDGLGFHPIAVGPLPPAIAVLVKPHCLCQLTTLQAGLAGERTLAIEALMLDPLCSHLTPSEVRKMGDELMAATREWLPQFN